jgi:3-oxoacyl-[acyl-carrier protein] reductase/meso-butanediol dehydrogenase/(S,S)-butanediol dehydrogenase/diacetyl reductase
LSDWEAATRTSETIVAQCDSVDILINNVGKSEWRSIERIDEAFFSEMMALNVASYVAVTKAIVGHMGRGANVINISSMAAKRGSKFNSIYCATKFAINGLTQAWAKEFGERGIRVNALCPVLVRSEGLDAALVLPEAPAHDSGVAGFLADFTRAQTALGRLPDVEDVAGFCALISSSAAGALTGQCINIDCGVFPQ